MFDMVWIARVVPSRASTAQALIDTGKPCDATDADFSVLHLVGSAKKFTSQVREINNLFRQWSHSLSNHYCTYSKRITYLQVRIIHHVRLWFRKFLFGGL